MTAHPKHSANYFSKFMPETKTIETYDAAWRRAEIHVVESFVTNALEHAYGTLIINPNILKLVRARAIEWETSRMKNGKFQEFSFRDVENAPVFPAFWDDQLRSMRDIHAEIQTLDAVLQNHVGRVRCPDDCDMAGRKENNAAVGNKNFMSFERLLPLLYESLRLCFTRKSIRQYMSAFDCVYL